MLGGRQEVRGSSPAFHGADGSGAGLWPASGGAKPLPYKMTLEEAE